MTATQASTGQKVDIEEIVESWAKKYFKDNATTKERKLFEKNHIQVEIDWRRVKFIHDEAKYVPEPPTPGSGEPTQTVLFNTTFTNKTTEPQMYSFKTERTTRSSCTVCLEQCYTKGVNVDLKLTTPCQMFEANVGFHREMALCNSESETIEEEMTWGVDSQIQVLGGHVGDAKLVILEEEYKGQFFIKTTLSGRVKVNFLNKKDNNSFIRAVEYSVFNVVKEHLKDFSDSEKRYGDALTLKTDTKTVEMVARGTCRFKYGIRQMIEIDQKPINNKKN